MFNANRRLDRRMHAQYIMLQVDLYTVNQQIEANMDSDPKAFNFEAKDMTLRAERTRLLDKIRGFKQ
jgi:hypothetical protein